MNYIGLRHFQGEAEPMLNFSIKWLLLAVAYVALSVAALLNANDYWRYGFESVAFLLLLTALLGMSFSLRQRRAFWAGWFVFSAAWFLFALGLFEFSRGWTARLITTSGLNSLHGHVITPTSEVHRQASQRLAAQGLLAATIGSVPTAATR